MKGVLLYTIFLFLQISAVANIQTDSLLQRLDKEVEKVDFYVNQKQDKINTLKSKIHETKDNKVYQYRLYDSIFNKYKSFEYDSAFKYLQELQNIAYQLDDPRKIAYSKINHGFIFVSSGMLKMAFDSLETVKPQTLSNSGKQEYYSVMTILNYAIADYQDQYYSPKYEKKAYLYTDSILNYAGSDSYEYLYYKGLRHIRKGNFNKGLENLKALQDKEELSLHQKAIINSTLSDVYINLGEKKQAINLLARASIYDIQTATKETAAILNLANLLYQTGEINRAYRYAKQALKDAQFYGARQRQIQVGKILPIIEEKKFNTVEKQRQTLLSYSIAITILSIIVVVFIMIILKQLKKIKKAEKEIKATNHALRQSNRKLMESNKIKEDYIGYYFINNSYYIDKIENLKKSVEKHLNAHKYDHVRYIIDRLNPKKERTALYKGFDRVFLNLFPNFVDEFNKLFAEEDQIQLSKNELLNTDLRIYALIRLGITENDKIANILGYSVNTIYAYKTRIKNKSLVSNEEFENRIMEIKVT